MENTTKNIPVSTMKNAKMTEDEQFERVSLESLKHQKSIATEAQKEPDSHLLKVHWDYSTEYGDWDSGVTEWRYTEKDGIYSFTDDNENTPREHSSIEEFLDSTYPANDAFCGGYTFKAEDEDGNVVYKRGDDQKTI